MYWFSSNIDFSYQTLYWFSSNIDFSYQTLIIDFTLCWYHSFTTSLVNVYAFLGFCGLLVREKSWEFPTRKVKRKLKVFDTCFHKQIFHGIWIMMEKIVDLWNVPFGSILLMIFPSQFKFDGNLICSYSNSDKVFIAKFCTCHDSCAVVACAKICCDLSTKNWIIAKWSFHQTSITSKISTVKCAAMPSLFPYCWRSIPGKQRENRKGSNLGPLSMPGFVGGSRMKY